MSKIRLRFTKTGKIKYISHLDLCRTLRRAFARAGIKLRYSDGFNPHPYLSVALPLSVGYESICEIMDIETEHEPETLPYKLNAVLPEGLKILDSYIPTRKASEIAQVDVCGIMEYNNGVPSDSVSRLCDYFKSDSIIIQKKTKRTNIDIIPQIGSIGFIAESETSIKLNARLSAQNPGLNPAGIIIAIAGIGLAPDFVSFKRLELYDASMQVFR